LKTLKDFLSDYKVEEPQPVVEEKVEVELPLELHEEFEINHLQEVKEDPHDMPAMLIMRRKSIRKMGNGQKVALYYVDKLDKYVTIPYGENTWFTTMESAEPIEESVIDHLKYIVEHRTAKSVSFEDGKSMRVDVHTAKSVLKMHESLNEENKKKMADTAQKSKEHFGRVVDFAWKHSKG
jgi:hypothetical protein